MSERVLTNADYEEWTSCAVVSDWRESGYEVIELVEKVGAE